MTTTTTIAGAAAAAAAAPPRHSPAPGYMRGLPFSTVADASVPPILVGAAPATVVPGGARRRGGRRNAGTLNVAPLTLLRQGQRLEAGVTVDRWKKKDFWGSATHFNVERDTSIFYDQARGQHIFAVQFDDSTHRELTGPMVDELLLKRRGISDAQLLASKNRRSDTAAGDQVTCYVPTTSYERIRAKGAAAGQAAAAAQAPAVPRGGAAKGARAPKAAPVARAASPPPPRCVDTAPQPPPPAPLAAGGGTGARSPAQPRRVDPAPQPSPAELLKPHTDGPTMVAAQARGRPAPSDSIFYDGSQRAILPTYTSSLLPTVGYVLANAADILRVAQQYRTAHHWHVTRASASQAPPRAVDTAPRVAAPHAAQRKRPAPEQAPPVELAPLEPAPAPAPAAKRQRTEASRPEAPNTAAVAPRGSAACQRDGPPGVMHTIVEWALVLAEEAARRGVRDLYFDIATHACADARSAVVGEVRGGIVMSGDAFAELAVNDDYVRDCVLPLVAEVERVRARRAAGEVAPQRRALGHADVRQLLSLE